MGESSASSPQKVDLKLQACNELAEQLEEYDVRGLPLLKGFVMAPIGEEAMRCIRWAESPENLETVTDWTKLDPNEASRQAVIKELIATEAGYISHLRAIVEARRVGFDSYAIRDDVDKVDDIAHYTTVFMATAHALQDAGKLLEVDTARLFANIPDVLNSSLFFWNTAYQPMVLRAIETCSRYNPNLMYPGFFAFRDTFEPYEQYVCEQPACHEYLRSLQTNPDFMVYLNWCQAQSPCQRLQLSDMLVKPMQRITKYGLILRRIIDYTEDEDEKATLRIMEDFTKTYVLDVNRHIRQKEEVKKLEELAETIDSFELDCKDDEMDRLFRLHSNVNLRAPMPGCLPQHQRSIIYQGDLRMRDHKDQKVDVRAFLLTDLLVITRKNKTQVFSLKVIRPKYRIDQLFHYPQFKNPKNSREMSSIVCVVTDSVGSAVTCFTLSDPNKDNPHGMKMWEQKIREAKLSFEMSVWFAQNSTRDVAELEPELVDLSRSGAGKVSSEEISIEREARERVVTMLPRVPGTNEIDFSDYQEDEEMPRPGSAGQRFPLQRTSTGSSSRHSRLSSLQHSSAASHDEPGPSGSKYSFRCGSSVEHVIPPANPNEEPRSITVNVMSEEMPEPLPIPMPTPSPPSRLLGSGVPSASTPRPYHNLRVQPSLGALAIVHSLPDLTLELARHHEAKRQPPPAVTMPPMSGPQSASARLYAVHQETLQRNRLAAAEAAGKPITSHFLSPDTRGTSYPPPSPTRASLRRSMAFSYSFKNPPLAKMGHVKSESHQQPGDLNQAALELTVASNAAQEVPAAAEEGRPSRLDPVEASTTAPEPYTSDSRAPSESQAREEGAVNQVLVGNADKKKGFSASTFFTSGGWYGKGEG